MRVFRLLLPLLALCFFGMADRPPTISFRFYAEANARDGASFSTPVKLGNPLRDAFLEKVPTIHEGMIKSIYPFRAEDGTWGCSLRLDNSGRINLEVVSTERRGTYFIGFLATKKGNHRLPDLIIDRTVSDGIITVPRGLTDLEMVVLGKQFKVVGDPDLPKLTVPKEKRGWNPFRKKEPAPAPAS